MKKFLIILIPVILITFVVSILLFSISGTELFSKLPFTNELYKESSLSITTSGGIATVLIDDNEIGQTPLDLSDLEPGPHKIQLTRDSDTTGYYEPEIYFIELMPNTESIIDVEIGPAGVSAGYVLYYTESPRVKGSGLISISGFPGKADVYINDDITGQLPIYSSELETGEYQIRIKSDGFEDVVFPAIVREGLNLNISVKLLPIPTDLELLDVTQPAEPNDANPNNANTDGNSEDPSNPQDQEQNSDQNTDQNVDPEQSNIEDPQQ